MDTSEPVTDENLAFTCERCGYVYKKLKDYPPYLCHRCMRYISKKTWTTVQTLNPPVSSPHGDNL